MACRDAVQDLCCTVVSLTLVVAPQAAAEAAPKNSGFFGAFAGAFEAFLKVLDDGLEKLHVPYRWAGGWNTRAKRVLPVLLVCDSGLEELNVRPAPHTACCKRPGHQLCLTPPPLVCAICCRNGGCASPAC